MTGRKQPAQKTTARQRKIQDETDRRNAQSGPSSDDKAMQAGQRIYPTGFEDQHLKKPGSESDLEPAPMYDAPAYKGSEKLVGRVALITGADSGIGRSVAVLFAREGADVAIVYLSEHKDADDTKRAVENEGRRCITISGDVSDPEFCHAAVNRTLQELGALDILVNNAAFQEHSNDILELSNEQFDETLKTICMAIST